jgi:hypothetical protein
MRFYGLILDLNLSPAFQPLGRLQLLGRRHASRHNIQISGVNGMVHTAQRSDGDETKNTT